MCGFVTFCVVEPTLKIKGLASSTLFLFTNHDLQNNNNNNKTKRYGLKIQYLTQTLKDKEKRN
jgi:hypothetical protein